MRCIPPPSPHYYCITTYAIRAFSTTAFVVTAAATTAAAGTTSTSTTVRFLAQLDLHGDGPYHKTSFDVLSRYRV
jgi:hypothetical protein